MRNDTWLVLVDRFPNPPGAKVGVVVAPTKREAEEKARDHYGAGHVVMRSSSSAQEATP